MPTTSSGIPLYPFATIDTRGICHNDAPAMRGGARQYRDARLIAEQRIAIEEACLGVFNGASHNMDSLVPLNDGLFQIGIWMLGESKFGAERVYVRVLERTGDTSELVIDFVTSPMIQHSGIGGVSVNSARVILYKFKDAIRSDSEIKEAIQSALRLDPRVSAFTPDVTVEGGVGSIRLIGE